MWDFGLGVFLRIANYFFSRAKAKAETRRKWKEVLEAIASDENISVNLNKADIDQHDDLQKQWEAKYKKDPEIAIRERQNPGKKFRRDEHGNIVPDRKRPEE